jgi:hypothetical protein
VEEPSDYTQRKGRAFFEETFRAVISHVGGMLAEYDLLGEPKGHYPAWQKTGTGNTFRYSINPGMEVVGCDAVSQYEKLYLQYRALVITIGQRKTELEQTRAKELWDSV